MAKFVVIDENVAIDSAARALLDRDIIFLCTDDHWGRSIVNQISYQYLIPTINLGARISSNDGHLEEAIANIDVLRPSKPCLWCKQFLRADRIAAESMPAVDRAGLEAEGYVQGIDDTAPSVISITTTISGLAVSVFLQLLTDFMGPFGGVERLNYDAVRSALRRGAGTVADGCICQKVKGTGDLKVLNTLVAK